MLTKAQKRKWLKALRSGDYKQGTGELCNLMDGVAEYCCLGVLYEVVNGEDAWRSVRCSTKLQTRSSNTDMYGEMLLGHPVDSELDHAGDLADKNDTGYSFRQLADYIEKKVETK